MRYGESPTSQLSLSCDSFRAMGEIDAIISSHIDTVQPSVSALQRSVTASLPLRFMLTKLSDVSARLQILYNETVLSRKGLTTITLALQKSLWTCGSAGITFLLTVTPPPRPIDDYSTAAVSTYVSAVAVNPAIAAQVVRLSFMRDAASCSGNPEAASSPCPLGAPLVSTCVVLSLATYSS